MLPYSTCFRLFLQLESLDDIFLKGHYLHIYLFPRFEKNIHIALPVKLVSRFTQRPQSFLYSTTFIFFTYPIVFRNDDAGMCICSLYFATVLREITISCSSSNNFEIFWSESGFSYSPPQQAFE